MQRTEVKWRRSSYGHGITYAEHPTRKNVTIYKLTDGTIIDVDTKKSYVEQDVFLKAEFAKYGIHIND